MSTYYWNVPGRAPREAPYCARMAQQAPVGRLLNCLKAEAKFNNLTVGDYKLHFVLDPDLLEPLKEAL